MRFLIILISVFTLEISAQQQGPIDAQRKIIKQRLATSKNPRQKAYFIERLKRLDEIEAKSKARAKAKKK